MPYHTYEVKINAAGPEEVAGILAEMSRVPGVESIRDDIQLRNESLRELSEHEDAERARRERELRRQTGSAAVSPADLEDRP